VKGISTQHDWLLNVREKPMNRIFRAVCFFLQERSNRRRDETSILSVKERKERKNSNED